MTKRKHRLIKTALIIILVPILLMSVRIFAVNFSDEPLRFVVQLTEGILFTYLITYLYEKYFENKPSPAERATVLEEDVKKMKYEVEQIKLVLSEHGLLDIDEVTVTASIQRDIADTIEYLEEVENNKR